MFTNDPFNNLYHHAYLLIGDTLIRDSLISILEKTYKIKSQGNPDFYIRSYETFTIDDAREVKSLYSSRPVGGAGRGDSQRESRKIKNENEVGTFDILEKKIFILTMNSITIEAQNALLKLLEEPAEYAHFFLIIPSAHLLLPTVKSRMREIDIRNWRLDIGNLQNEPKDKELIEQANLFIKASQAKRLEIVKKLTDEISKDFKTKQDAIDFLNAIQEIVYKESRSTLDQISTRVGLDAIETTRNYLNDRAPSVKMLLEFVALSV